MNLTNLSEAITASAIEAMSIYPRRRNPYPRTVAECLDDSIKFKSGTDEVIAKFKKSRPWKGTTEEVQEKIKILCRGLSEVYDIPTPVIAFVDKFPTGPCCFRGSEPALIIMAPAPDGRYSVVTFLHEFGHCLGKGEKSTCRWSLNLFRKHFPKSFARLTPQGHLLYRSKK